MNKYSKKYDPYDDPTNINYVSKKELEKSLENYSVSASLIVGVLFTTILILMNPGTTLLNNLLLLSIFFIVSSIVLAGVAYLLIGLFGNFVFGFLEHILGFKIACIICCILLSAFFIYRIFIIKA